MSPAMRRSLFLSTLSLIFAAGLAAQSSPPAPKAGANPTPAPISPRVALQAARASFAKLPLLFEENLGQTDGRVKFTSRGSGYNLFLATDEAVFALRGGNASSQCPGASAKINRGCADPAARGFDVSILRLRLLGADSSAQVVGSELQPGKINYYTGNDPGKWRLGVRQYGRVSYQNIYPGVDLTYYGNQRQLESDFVVQPGANPRAIEFSVSGANTLRIDEQGNLVLGTVAGNVELLRPGIYQTVNGIRRDVSGRYILRGKDRVGLEIASYDPRTPLVIDPIFIYSTYLGGGDVFSGGDSANAIAVDSTGAAYVTGTGGSLDFPGSAIVGPVAQATPFVFVTKFDPTGNSIVYSTLLRGTTGFSDTGYGIALDGSGNAHVTGITGDDDFPLLNPFQKTLGDVFSAGFYSGITSGFVASLDTNGALLYSTYFGGRNNFDTTNLSGIAADSAGNAFVVGDTSSLNFPTVNSAQAVSTPAYQGATSAVVAKFDPNGQPIYSTYLGGTTGADVGNAIAIDAAGNAYVTGMAGSTDFKVQSTPAPVQGVNNGGGDVFVSKLAFDSVHSTLNLVNSTFLGGSGTDQGFGIAVDTATPPNVYVTGETSSKATAPPFPTMNSIFPATIGSTPEAFVAKLSGDFSTLVYSTFLGGSGSAITGAGDVGNAIALDSASTPNVFITGSTGSKDFPMQSPLQSTLLGTTNAFVAEVNGAGSALLYSTYLGGAATDTGKGIAVDSTGNAYIAGSTTSWNFPVASSSGVGTAPFQDHLRSSSGNAFLTKISSAAAPSGLIFVPPVFNFHQTGVGLVSALETITLSNTTGASVTLNTLTIGGNNPGDFSISPTGTCINGMTLASTCIVNLTFNPQLQDARSATLTATYNSTNTSTMNLSGFGAVPELSFSPTTVSFGTSNALYVTTSNGVLITNRGGTALHVGNVEITGTDAAAYSIASNSCAVVAANGGSCSIGISFTPKAAQTYNNASLQINDDAAGSPQTVPLTGAGVAKVIVGPASFDFGGWLLQTTSLERDFIVQNGTGGNITLSISTSGNTADFPADPNNSTCTNGLLMLPGISCTYALSFAPVTAGSLSETVTFSWTGQLTGQQQVTAKGIGETGVTLYVTTYTAPTVNVGSTAKASGFGGFDQIFNGTTSPVLINSIVLSGANPADFEVQLDTSCSTNAVIPANSVCFLDGSFTPLALGTRTTTVTINYTIQSPSPTTGSLTLAVTATAIAGPVTFPSTFDFGSQIVSLTSPTQRLYLQNIGKVPLAISTVSGVTGANSADFAILSNSTCKSSITVLNGGKCFLDLTFTPGGTGSRTATITITDNGPGSPRTLTLTGTGESAAQSISVSPNALDFGGVVLLAPPATQTSASAKVYLINGGTQSVKITVAPALLTTGTPFAIATGTNTTCTLNQIVLPQGGTCTVGTTFTPANTTPQTNTLTFSYTVGSSTTPVPVSIPVTGVGINQAVVAFGASPTFTVAKGATTTAAKTVTLTNSGTGPARVLNLALTGTNSTDFAIDSATTTCAPGTTGFVVATGATCNVGITFTAPQTTGTFTTQARAVVDLGNNVTTTVSAVINGIVVAGGISVTPTPPLDFGPVATGSTITWSTLNGFVTLTNNNATSIVISNVAFQNATTDFTVTSNNCLTTLAPTNSCTFDITFAPTIIGSEPANNIAVTYTGASGSPFLIAIKGAGASGLVATPNPLNESGNLGSFVGAFPSITLGNGTASSTIAVTNVSAISGAGYALSFNACTFGPLAPGSNCQISLTYNPTVAGNSSTTFNVTYTVDAGSPLTLTVTLNSSVAAPKATITPTPSPSTPLIFPGQLINTQSLPLSVVVQNTGTAPLTFSGFKITGTNSNDFAFGEQQSNSATSQYPNILSCTLFGFGNTIQPGQSCTILLTFTPAPPPLPTGATRSASLTITDNDPTTTQTVLLEGNITGGNVSVSPNSIAFPDTKVGQTVTQSVLVTNATTAAVSFTKVTFGTSSYSVDATQTLNACSTSKPLAAFTGTCALYIKFSPAAGANADTATIVTSNGSPTVALSGTGVSPVVSVSPTSFTFTPAQLVGTQSAPALVTLTNGLASSITITSVTPSPTSDYLLGTNNCTGTINAAGTCTVQVIFKPSTTGARAGSLQIVNSSNTLTVTLSGTGTAPATIAATSGSPQSVVVNSAFSTALQATVKDSGGNVLPGVTVTFTITAGGSGASGTFTGSVTTAQATTDSNGTATAPTLTANNIPGTFTVAAAAGAVGGANFSLTNLAGTPASITATSGASQSVAVSTAFATLQATVKDAGSLPLDGVVVTFTAPSSGASGTFTGGLTTATATTNTSGVASAPTFTANATAGGPYSVTATVGAVGPANFTLTNLAGAPSSIAATAGTPQSIAITKLFTTNLQATVKDSKGNLLSGVVVTFTAPASGASGTFAAPGTGATATATTNASGVATAPAFTANSTVGAYSVTAAVSGVSPSATFALSNLAGPPASITATAGTPQSIAVNTAFPATLQATVKDSGGNLASGVSVTFTAPSSGASGTFAAPGTGASATVTTNSSGVAISPIFTSNLTVGSYTVNAAVAGVSTPAAFSLTNIAGPAASITATAGTPQSAAVTTAFATLLQATVKDSGGNLVNGATVTFTAPATGSSGKFANGSATTTAVTGANGIATASAFTANTVAGGPYNVTATSGAATSANFSLTNTAGPAAVITATAGTPQSTVVTTAFATLLQATVKDASGNLVSGATVTFTAPTTGASGTFANGTNTTNAVTSTGGIASATAFTANTVAGGPYNVTATSGTATSANFSLTNTAGPAAVITATAGTPQSATISTAFTTALQATVKDSHGNVVANATVTFTSPSTGASGKFANGTNTTNATTSASGVATASAYTANSVAGGPYNVTATSGAATSANFSITNNVGPASAIAATGGATQSVAINTAFASLQATVKDSGGNGVSGVSVTFTVTAATNGASGTFAGGGASAIVTTDANGLATAPIFTSNSISGGPYTVAAKAGTIGPANFSLTNLSAPPASITASAGTPQSVAISTLFPTNLQATVNDKNNLPISGVTVTFTAPSTGASGTFAASGGNPAGITTTAVTNASGIATAPAFTANSTAGGPYNVQATASGVGPANFSLTNQTGPAATITAGSGATQSVIVNSAFAPLAVTVKDNGGNLISGATVTFTAPASGASGSFTGGTGTATAVTGANGIATAPTFTANSIAGGPYSVKATTGAAPAANFTLTNLPGLPATIILTSPASQSTAVNTAFASLQVTVKDSSGNGVPNNSVTFTAPGSGASGAFAAPGTGATATVTTNSSGLATAPTFTANNVVGGPYNVAASSGALPTINFSLTNLAGTPSSITATAGTPQSIAISTAFSTKLQATVKDKNSLPLSGVVVTFTAPSTGASGTFTGGSNTVQVTTDANGNAIAPVFSANATSGGPYTVTATAGAVGPANFSLTNLAGAPASVVTSAGTPQSIAISSAFTTNLQVTVKDSGGNVLSGVVVTFTAPSSGASGTFAAPGTGATATVTTNSSGVATAPVFTSNSTVGAYTVNATVSGVATAAAFSLTNLAGPPSSITATAGTPQSVTISAVFPATLQATVKDSGGNPVNGVSVTFTAPFSGASGTFAAPGTVATAIAITNASGIAISPIFTANGTSGAYSVIAKVTGVAATASFSLTNLAGPAASIAATAGTPQSAPVTTAFATALQATVKDSGGNLVMNATVTFTAPASGASGTFTGGVITAQSKTDVNGVATAPVFTANAIGGGPYNVTAAVAGVSATASFALTNTVAPDVAVTMTHPAGTDFVVNTHGQYTVTVTNKGTGPTTGPVSVSSSFHTGITYSSSGSAGWTCSVNPQKPQSVTCLYTGAPLAAAGGSAGPLILNVFVAANTITVTTPASTGFSAMSDAIVSDPNDSNPNGADKTAIDTVNLDNTVPTLASFTPTLGLIAGATTDQTITLTGTGFNASTQVNGFGTAPLTGTASSDGTTLTISIPHANLATPGSLTVTTTNPTNPTNSKGGGTNPAGQNQTFPIVGIAVSAHAGTPNPLPIVAGTPFMLQIDVPTTPSGTKLPADVTVSCSFPSSETGATCSATPGTLTAGTTAASTSIAINTVAAAAKTAATSTPMPWQGPFTPYLPWFVAVALLSLLGMWGKERLRGISAGRAPAYLTLALLVLAAGALVGCSTNSAAVTPTPKGPSTITVTATAADGATASATININVQ